MNVANMLICNNIQEVLKTFGEVRLAFGQSDEYSFVIHKNSDLYGRALRGFLTTHTNYNSVVPLKVLISALQKFFSGEGAVDMFYALQSQPLYSC